MFISLLGSREGWSSMDHRTLAELELYIRDYNEKTKGERYASFSPDHLRWIYRYFDSDDEENTRSIALTTFVRNLRNLSVALPQSFRFQYRKEISLSPFTNMRSLLLDDVKPSLIANMRELRSQLRQLSVHNTLNSLSELLDFEEHQVIWQLETLNCSDNNIPEIDESTNLLTHVTTLDLSHNLITKAKNLSFCVNLESLNLSFNHIRSLENINMNIGNIRILSLRHNRISCLQDLVKLYSLVKIDLSHNLIGSLVEVKHLNELPLLESVWMTNNPIETIDGYRWKTLKLFSFKEDFILDGQEVNEIEAQRLKRHQSKLKRMNHLKAVEITDENYSDNKSISPVKPVETRIVEIVDKSHTKKKKKIYSTTKEIYDTLEDFQKEVRQLRKKKGGDWIHEFYTTTQEEEEEEEEKEEEEGEGVIIDSELQQPQKIQLAGTGFSHAPSTSLPSAHKVLSKASLYNSIHKVSASEEELAELNEEEQKLGENSSASSVVLGDLTHVSSLLELDEVEMNVNRANIPEAMRLYISLNVFSSDQEHFVFLLRCNFVQFDSGNDKEKLCHVILSNQNIFILLKEGASYRLFGNFPLNDVKIIVVGLFYQWIRIRTSTGAFVLILRNHQLAHNFLEVFRECLLLDDPLTIPPITHSNDLIIRNISYQFCRGVPANDVLECYMTGYIGVRSSSYDACPLRKSLHMQNHAVTPMSLLVITLPQRTGLFLCKEDYANQPREYDCEQSDTHFPVITEQSVSSILGLEIDPDRPAFLSICFDSAKGHKSQVWDLFLPEKRAKAQLIRIISRLWLKLFNVSLRILESEKQ